MPSVLVKYESKVPTRRKVSCTKLAGAPLSVTVPVIVPTGRKVWSSVVVAPTVTPMNAASLKLVALFAHCTGEFQSRRLKLRYRDAKKQIHFCHTLNNTVIASPRILIPLLECHQQPDGSIRIPTALRPYLGGREVLGKL